MACVTLKRSLDFDPLYSPNRPNKRRRCVPMHCTPEKKIREGEEQKPSSFTESPLTPEQIANNLRDEIKRMKKRRQIVGYPSSPSSPGPSSPGPSNAPASPEPIMMDAEHLPSSSSSVQPQPPQQKKEEKPIFTLKQMTLIAERMCKERVDQVRQEYDEILQQKLSEQYESFVKFIDQQIQRRFKESQAPSYLS